MSMLDKRSIKKIILGGAQLGFNYGYKNKSKNFSLYNSKTLISKVLKFGIIEIDTAPAYGMSEYLIGSIKSSLLTNEILINTKLELKSLQYYKKNLDSLKADINKSINKSLEKLKINKINILFFHDADFFIFYADFLIKTIEEVKKRGLVSNIGVSIYTPEQANKILNLYDIDVLQIPFNIIDYRWRERLDFALLKTRLTSIHARSVFLQGILLPGEIKKFKYLKDLKKIHIEIEKLICELKRKSFVDMLFSYVLSQSFIDKVIIGFEDKNQFLNFIENINFKYFTEEDIKKINALITKVPQNLLDPRKWDM